jgi:hypothetical protein
LVISIWLFSNNAIYTGPIPKNNPQVGDITFLVGFAVTAVLYYAFAMATGKRSSPAAVGTRA